ncbi:MAG: hypothetical protein HY841_06005 [Bacteroidetes bacterium]|nr:hypothetical protein [Bacteroidota bacterium]
MKTTRNTAALLLDEEAQRFSNFLYPPRKPEKMLELFRLLRLHGKKELSREEKKEMKKKLYGNTSGGKQFDMLNHRLNEKIDDFFLSKSALKNHPVLEKLHAAQVDIKKKHTLYNFLQNTGRSGIGNDALMEKAIEGAKKYECYTDLIQLLHRKQIRRGYRLGEREIDKATGQIKFYKKCEHALRRATELYYRLVAKKKFSANPDIKSLQLFLKSGIKELTALYKQTGSPEVLYHLKYLELDFLQNKKNFDEARMKCVELLDLIMNNVSVFTRQRIDYGFGNLAQCYIYIGDYSYALQLIRKQKYILPYSLDWFESREMEFRILFYQKKFAKAKALLEVMLKNFPDDMEPIRKARINFYLTAVFFRQGAIKKAQAMLSVNSELMKDKSGWAISIRMLELMMLAVQYNKEEGIGKAKQLKQFLKYHPVVSKRDELMADLFLKMAQQDGKSMKGLRNGAKLFTAKKGDNAWDAMSHEIIRYDVWLGKFLKRRSSKGNL